jgi:uncharacterized glyoxalase superfamily protein PhnB
MSVQKVKAIPENMHSITPFLICEGASDAIAFYQRAFGATELSRLEAPNGKVMHAMIRIGDSCLMLADANPDCGMIGPVAGAGAPVMIHLYVEDADQVFARAVEHGATVRAPVSDMFWGDRYGVLVDPFGHGWSIATHVRDMTPDEIRVAMQDVIASAV